MEIAGNIAVRAREITRLDTLRQVAAIVVHAYALKAGTNAIAAKVESAGLTRIRSGITPARGELMEIR